MNQIKYRKMIEETTPKENRLMNMIISFIIGGIIGCIGVFLFKWLNNYYDEELSMAFVLLIFIAVTAFLTSLGLADGLFNKFRCGLIVPITGFAHSLSSCIIDYKKEGFLNIGSNAFKLAGAVILYGVVSAIILTLIKVILNV